MPIAVAALVLYLLAATLLATGLRRDPAHPGRTWLAIALAAIACHAAVHGVAWHLAQGPDMHFFAALSLSALGMASLTSLLARDGGIAALGIVVFPLAGIFALLYELHGHPPATAMDWQLQLHAWCALLAYATLAIAALLAVLLWIQEHALRQRSFHGWMRALPPLTELETLLFRTITVGFVLLTATLLSGLLFVHDLLGQHLAHKTLLSVLSWLVFGALLWGRWRRGWRGMTAVRWTLVAMGLLMLAFFGSQFVLELVLHRAP